VGARGDIAKMTMNMLVVDREKSAKIQIYNWLKERIISGAIAPGTVLDKRDLMQQLSVSLTPLREALLLLKHDGLVDLVPNLHTVVRLIDTERVREHVFIRAALECAVVEHLATEGLPETTETRCAKLIEQQTAAFARDDYERSFDLDVEFHRVLCDVLRYRILWDNIYANRSQIDRARQCSPVNVPGIKRSIEQHLQILDHIRAGNAAEARVLMRAHIYTVFDDLSKIDPRYLETRAGG
jgi:GntR family transcriptional regulator, rspAB operon transcriptional repressor